MDKRQYVVGSSFALLLCLSVVADAGLFDALDKLDRGSPLGGQREFLDPELAFRFSHEVDRDGAVWLNWEIAPGYYLYRDKVTVKSTQPEIEAAILELPEGEMKDDPEFGRVAIFKHDLAVRAGLSPAGSAPPTATLQVGYQGCAEDGICYPPIKKNVDVLLDAVIAPAAAAESPQGASAAQPSLVSADDIAAQLAGRSLVVAAGTFYVFGLLLAFTPCVFPLVPILSGIIVGQRQPVSARRGLMLSGIYVLTVAFTYALVGLVAGLFGHNLQASFQQPAVLIVFAAIFVALALSMFGFYELRLPAGLQTRIDRYSRTQRGGNIIGVAAMGVLSAIIVGPCVAPPLAGALIYLGHQGSPLVGGTALFMLGLGMGTPLLLVGASAGKLLPRAGVWMDAVKQVFGVMLLGVAIWFLERILPGPAVLLLWALLIMVSAIYLGALDPIREGYSGWRRLFKGVGLALLCYGAVLIAGAGAGADDPLHPLRPLAGAGRANDPGLAFAPIKGVAGFEAALEGARAQGRAVVLDFYADWCIECKYLERDTFRHAEVAALLSEAVLLRADVTANDEHDQELLKRFELFGPPAVLFFDTQGTEYRRHRVVGFLGPADFTQHLAALGWP